MTDKLEAIRTLLWKEWDPIGVNDEPDAFGEYDTYADQIHAMLDRGGDAEEISRHLSWVVTTLIGLGTNDQHSMKIAKKAVAIYLGHASI
jgi:hypothetical protein